MRVVIVTGTAEHHRFLCAYIAHRFDVVGIIHPLDASARTAAKLKRMFRQLRKKGLVLGALDSASRLLESRTPAGTPAPSSSHRYSDIPPEKIVSNCRVRSPEALATLKVLAPDVTIFLGGPVYPREFIAQAGLAFNFHSGLSPIYNGASSTQFAYANGHPHLCGGTLMRMEAKVDGGGILGHFLPELAGGDSPVSIFHKTVAAAPEMYANLLRHIESAKEPPFSIPQQHPLFYYRSADFGYFQRVMILRHQREDLPARFTRKGRTLEYWREKSAGEAEELYQRTLDELLWRPIRCSRK